jgi:hypothetical protein
MVTIDGGVTKEESSMEDWVAKRYRVTFTGPGGHNYGFGVVSPFLAMGNAIQRFSRVQSLSKPKTTFNLGLVGGTSCEIPIQLADCERVISGR